MLVFAVIAEESTVNDPVDMIPPPCGAEFPETVLR
jgi:hypothetical protein